MRPYQEQYLALLHRMSDISIPSADTLSPEEFVAESAKNAALAGQMVEEGTQLLRQSLFPVLDDILAASREETEDLAAFAAALMRVKEGQDVGLHYRIHMALVSYARRCGDRDMLIRELYEVGMSLYTMQHMLSPSSIRLYNARMRLSFSEAASHFETDYDEIENPETRGYIHRSMGNISLCYETNDERSAQAKLAACTRSIRILSDPDVRAKTPSLPWDRYLYASHQQRTSLLSYLRSGNAGHEAFAQVLESAQIVREKQMRDMRERGEPLQPRWQYAYLAALYHSGAMHLTELLDGLYGLGSSCDDDDFGAQSAFSHIGAPAYYMEYSTQLPDSRLDGEVAARIDRLTRRMCRWIVRLPGHDPDDTLMFFLRAFLYGYRELPGCMPFSELLQNVYAARHPPSYLRQWIAGRTARLLAGWAVDDMADKLTGLLGTQDAAQVRARREEILDFAQRAGNLYDTGMIHFIGLEGSACRGIFEEEGELLRLHAHCGWKLLSAHPSTKPYADVALGHHTHYDGKGGYPVDFSLQESRLRPVICIVAAADVLASAIPEAASRFRPARDFEAALKELERGAGTAYSPLVTGLLTPARRETLKKCLEEWRAEACLDMYRRRASLSDLAGL